VYRNILKLAEGQPYVAEINQCSLQRLCRKVHALRFVVKILLLHIFSKTKQEAFEKCWAHSPLRAASRQFTRCRKRYCRAPPAHRCPRQRRRRQRQRVTERTAMAPWNGPKNAVAFVIRFKLMRLKRSSMDVVRYRKPAIDHGGMQDSGGLCMKIAAAVDRLDHHRTRRRAAALRDSERASECEVNPASYILRD